MTLSDAAAHQDITTVEVPTHWYNLAAELDTPIPPHLHPGTKEPVQPEDLAPLFASGLIAQEASTEAYHEIPEPVREILRFIPMLAVLIIPIILFNRNQAKELEGKA